MMKREFGEFRGPTIRDKGELLTPAERFTKVIDLVSTYEELEKKKELIMDLNREKEKLAKLLKELTKKEKYESRVMLLLVEYEEILNKIKNLNSQIQELEKKFNIQRVDSCNHDLNYLFYTNLEHEECVCMFCLASQKGKKGDFKNIITDADIIETTGNMDISNFIIKELPNKYFQILFKYVKYFQKNNKNPNMFNPQKIAKSLYRRYKSKEEFNKNPYIIKDTMQAEQHKEKK